MAKSKKIGTPILFESTFAAYKVVDALGENKTGRTFKCIDETGNTWVVRLLDPRKATRAKISRFKEELTFCLGNTHPNIVTVHDHGLYKGANGPSPFYVMRLYQGSLRGMIDTGIKPERILPYFRQLLDGVEAAHLKGHFHHDLKPENILFDTSNNTLSLCDFGIAHFKEMKKYSPFERKNIAKIAECQYAAPEQHSSGEADARADIYALGIILKEMFTREMPHRSLRTIESAAPDYAYLDYLASRMMRRKPGERPFSVAAVKSELIGRRNEFVSHRRLSELKETRIPELRIDDPLIADPPRIIDFDYVRGRLILTFSRAVNDRWISAFKHMRKFSYPLGYHPARFSFCKDRAEIEADERVIGEVIKYFRGWLTIATGEYEDLMTQAAQNEYERTREELREEIEEQERRLRVFKSIRIPG